MNGHEIDLIRKKLEQLLKKHRLSIQIKCNLKSVDFLDITFNLKDESYKPFNKPNNEPLYINTESNHPPTIIKQIPESVSKRLSANSSNESIFNAAAPYYNEILEKCGYKDKLTYQKEPTIKKKRQRTRNITWFNPPFNKNVKTKVGEFFLKSVDKHFGKNSKLNKIFNRNTLKVSYSCMNNMDQIVKAHNNKVTNPIETQEKTCNCRNKQSCPLNGACQVTNIVYKAEVTNNRDSTSKKTYIGISQPTFKERLRNHNKSFKHKKYEKETELSKYIWQLKEAKTKFSIKWTILRRTSGYNNVTKSCNLCTSEKLAICNFKDKANLINKRNELISKCRHENRYVLNNFTCSHENG